MQYLRCIYKKLFIIYIKFNLNRVSCILSGNPTLDRSERRPEQQSIEVPRSFFLLDKPAVADWFVVRKMYSPFILRKDRIA